MTNTTENKKAIVDMFRMEDAVGLCESYGNNVQLEAQFEEDFTPVTMDGLFDVVPNNNPTAGEAFQPLGQDDTKDPQAAAEMTEMFVSALQNEDPTEPVNWADMLPNITTKIVGAGYKGDIDGFVNNLKDQALATLAHMNVSDKNPEGAAPTESIEPELEPNPENGDPTGAAGVVPPMQEIPGAVEPPEPTLTANQDDPLGIGGLDELANLGLGGEEPAAEPEVPGTEGAESLGEFNIGEEEPAAVPSEEPAAEEPAAPAEELPAPAEGEADGDIDLSALDGLNDDDFSVGGEGEPAPEGDDAAESKPAEEDEKKSEPMMEGTEGAEVADGTGVSVEPEVVENPAEAPVSETVDPETNPETDPELECVQKKLSDARNAFMEARIAEDIHAVFESCRAERAARNAKKAQLDAIVESVHQHEQEIAAKAQMESAAEADRTVMAQLEAISADYHAKAAKKREQAQFESIVGNYARQVKAEAIAKQHAMEKQIALESIVANFGAEQKREAALESIVNEFHGNNANPVMESVDPLKAQLDEIAEKTKALMA